MSLRLDAEAGWYKLAQPFIIARGRREAIELLTVTLRDGDIVAQGEGSPSTRYGETGASVLAEVEAIRPKIEAGLSREALRLRMKPGAARNAIDCALWDLEAKRSGISVEAGLGPFQPAIRTALSMSIGSPEAMAHRARQFVSSTPEGMQPLIKIKLDAHMVAERILAIREAAPKAILIADANESWDRPMLERNLDALLQAGVEMIEQPLPAGADEALTGFQSPVPIFADESAHGVSDVDAIRARYQGVTIKLDKAGGLTEALALADAAEAVGMTVMTGCMLCSTLSVAAAWPLARRSRYVDLDGPLWLHPDLGGACRLSDGMLPYPRSLRWGAATA